MVELLLFQKILLSLAIGALIGLERQRRARGEIFAGIRTFMLVCLFGLLVGYLSGLLSSYVPIYLGLFSIGLLSVASYVEDFRKTKSIGVTTEIAFMLTFIIGVINFFESYPYFLTISLGILLTFVLISLESLHAFARHLTRKEIRDAIVFAILIFIILPILPNEPVDPFGALNPYTIWLSVVIVLSISFAAYVAMKIFGAKKGLALTGLFGGLASSTAVAISMAEKVKQNKRILYSATFATVIAASTMFFRQVLLTSFFNYSLAISLFVPLVILGVLGYIMSYFLWRKSEKEKTIITIGSPLALRPALQFAIFFTLILFVSHLAQNYFGYRGLFMIAIIAGLVDVDAITISLATLSLSSLSPILALIGIILAGISNTFSKWFLVNWLGTKKMGTEVGKAFGILIVAGVIILLFLGLL